MNVKDCESLGFILGELDLSEDTLARFFALDPRIEDEYRCFRQGADANEQIMKRYDALMIEHFGYSWAILKKTAEFTEKSRQLYQQAQREIAEQDS